jgi:hypothetical protein
MNAKSGLSFRSRNTEWKLRADDNIWIYGTRSEGRGCGGGEN